jgi:uroporphyrinogen decarboxylase
VGWANSYYQNFKPGNTYTDEWGIGWKAVEYKTKFGNGIYTEIDKHPLASDKSVLSYVPPDPHREELYEDSKLLLKQYGNEYFIVGVTVTTIFETAWALRGLEQMLLDFYLDPDLAHQILEIPYQYHLTAAKKLATLGVDMIWVGDDIGAQDNMLISMDAWRTFFKPRMANFIQELKSINRNVKVAYHSDGNIMDMIPELIEIGLDVLNPIQPASMDPALLKRKFGDKLCFWGTIDEQHTLPFGTVDDVIGEVKNRVDTIGKNGGLIIGPTHHVQLDTPMENFQAMVETIKNYGYVTN